MTAIANVPLRKKKAPEPLPVSQREGHVSDRDKSKFSPTMPQEGVEIRDLQDLATACKGLPESGEAHDQELF